MDDYRSINIQTYQLSAMQLDGQTKQITKLVEKRLIQESSSSWGLPVLLTKKFNEIWQMCIDYRAVNDQTEKEYIPSFSNSRLY